MILHGSSFAVYRCDEDRRDEPRGVVRPYRAREITDGLDGTAIRGGVVKFGTGYNTISDSEDKVMRAALACKRPQRATIAPRVYQASNARKEHCVAVDGFHEIASSNSMARRDSLGDESQREKRLFVRNHRPRD